MKKGELSFATGPMFSGKTTWLINTLSKRNKKETLVFRYFMDTRYATDSIATHDNKKMKAYPVKTGKEILSLVKNNLNVKTVGIDELQFFKPTIDKLLRLLKNNGIEIFAAGLNVDYRNKIWKTTEKVLPISDKVYKLTAICAICGKNNATITNRKERKNARIVIGGAELYESLCEKDYALVVSS